MKRVPPCSDGIGKSGRPQEFDRDEVLTRAMELFWTQGYEATSIQDLVEATGINRGSIYHAFGDKEGFFLAALDHYAVTVAKSLIAELADPDPRRAMKRLFEFIVRNASDRKRPRGCLLTNTALECRPGAENVLRSIEESFRQVESAVYAVVRRAKAEGLLPATCDARALARFFFCLVQGLNVMNKTFADTKEIEDVATVAMSLWEQAVSTSPRGLSARQQNAS